MLFELYILFYTTSSWIEDFCVSKFLSKIIVGCHNRQRKKKKKKKKERNHWIVKNFSILRDKIPQTKPTKSFEECTWTLAQTLADLEQYLDSARSRSVNRAEEMDWSGGRTSKVHGNLLVKLHAPDFPTLRRRSPSLSLSTPLLFALRRQMQERATG